MAIKAGCLAIILPPPDGRKGLNTGRVVRVLLPAELRGWPPAQHQWLIAAIDGQPLRVSREKVAMQVVRPEQLLERINEGATNDNDA